MLESRLCSRLPGSMVLCLLSFSPLIAFPDSCWIARDGAPQAALVSPVARTGGLAESIGDMQRIIERMSGAAIEVCDRPPAGMSALWLLTEADLRSAELAGLYPADLARLASLNEEGFLLRVRAGEAWLVGRTELALQHAVYWLLEQWGCRWLFPGPEGEVIPSAASLAVTSGMETAQQPRFLMRDLWYNWGGRLPAGVQEDARLWRRRNRLQYSLTGTIGHAYKQIVPFKGEFFEQHPDYFPLENGRHVPRGQIATGHPEVRKLAVDYASRFFQAHPDARMVSMSPNDGGGPWRDTYTRRTRFSDAALDLANHVAWTLREKPETREKKVAMYAYFDTARPPTIRAEDNVVIFLATRFTLTPWRWLVRSWSKKVNHLAIRDYGSILPWHWTRPAWRLGRLERKVRFWDRNGIVGVSVETGNDWGGWGLYHYVMARLLWNPDEDVKQIVQNYLQAGFGKTAPLMKRYFERWRWGYNRGTLEGAIGDVKAAFDRAESPEIQRRVGLYALYLQHQRLCDEYRQALSPARKKESMRALVAFDWRLVPTGMAHTLPLVDVYLKKEAARKLRIHPEIFDSWKEEKPFTPEEVSRVVRGLTSTPDVMP